MGKKRTPGLYERNGLWHIDKCIKKYGRLCESTGSSDEEEAGRYLARRIEEIRQAAIYGIRPRRKFRDAATKYLTDYASKKRSIGRDALALKDMDSFIGGEWLDCVHNETFKPYIEARQNPPEGRKPLAVGTLNRNIGVARRILILAARLWRDPGSNLTWLAEAPLIQLETKYAKRKPYPLDWEEERLLFRELAPHLQRMAVFDVNTGMRDQELCSLRWEWEQRIPELDAPEIQRSVFVLPEAATKNGESRVVVLNDAAQKVLEEVRGEHRAYVFTFENHKKKRDRLYSFRNSGWKAARRRAALKYKDELGTECPEGFKRVRVHDLRHTFGRRLRAVGVGLEDRADLLGHKGGRITTHYSAAEIGNLVEAANRITKSRKSPALTMLRVTG